MNNLTDVVSTVSIGLQILVALAVIAVLALMRLIFGAQQQLSASLQQVSTLLNDITHTQQIISQSQREQTAIQQQLITQLAVMDARQGGYHPNE